MEKITHVWFSPQRIYIRTDADNIYSRPLAVFPTLLEASGAQREEYKIWMDGEAIRWEVIDEDIHISSFLEPDDECALNPVSKIFSRFPELDVSALARSVGIGRDLFYQYVYGLKRPSEEETARIREVLHELGKRLMDV